MKALRLTIGYICGVLVSMFASSAVNHGFEPNTINFVFFAKHAALRSKIKDWFSESG